MTLKPLHISSDAHTPDRNSKTLPEGFTSEKLCLPLRKIPATGHMLPMLPKPEGCPKMKGVLSIKLVNPVQHPVDPFHGFNLRDIIKEIILHGPVSFHLGKHDAGQTICPPRLKHLFKQLIRELDRLKSR